VRKLASPARPKRAHSPGSGRRRVRAFGWLLVALGCTPSGGTTYDEAVADFVEAWDFARGICDAQVVCGGAPVGPCDTAYRDPEQIVSGVTVAHMDIQALLRCQDSAAMYGACLAPLDCIDLANAATCTFERWRYDIDCAALHTSLDFLDGGATGGTASVGGTGGSGGTGPVGGSGGATPSVQTSLATDLCERAEACTGVRWSPEQQATCRAESVPLFGPLIVDPASTKGCVASAGCSALAGDIAGLVTSCVDLNQATVKCVDARAIHACTWANICTDLPCRDVCSSQGGITLGCGLAPSAAGDACQCG
jgi:hypothetical protein